MMPKTSPCFCGLPSKFRTIQVASDDITYRVACADPDCFIGRRDASPRGAAAFWDAVMAGLAAPEPCP